MKKKNIVLLSALLFSVSAIAQTEVTAGVTRGKDYGVTYVLPKTEIELTVQATKTYLHSRRILQVCRTLSAAEQRLFRTGNLLDTGQDADRSNRCTR